MCPQFENNSFIIIIISLIIIIGLRDRFIGERNTEKKFSADFQNPYSKLNLNKAYV